MKCQLHRKCEVIKAAKKLPYSAEIKIAEWLLAGKRFPNKDDAYAHKNMFAVSWHSHFIIENP